jgi:magnesium chelatase subunit D
VGFGHDTEARATIRDVSQREEGEGQGGEGQGGGGGGAGRGGTLCDCDQDDCPHGTGDIPWETRLAFDEALLFRELQGLRPPRLEWARHRRRDLSGRRSKTRTETSRGRYVRSRPTGEYRDLALDATIRAAAPHQRERPPGKMRVSITRADLQTKVRERKAGNVLLFLVDASSSMGTQQRMVATQGAILSLLVDAYQRRERVGLVTFREHFAEIILRPTSSVEKAKRAFEGILLGGTTPLSAGLVAAVDLLETERRKNRDLMPLLILITDGMPNISIGEMDPEEEAMLLGRMARHRRIPSVVLDSEAGYTRSLAYTSPGRAREIASAMGAQYVPVADMTYHSILEIIARRGRPATG